MISHYSRFTSKNEEAKTELNSVLETINEELFEKLLGGRMVDIISDDGEISDDLAYRGFMLKIVETLIGKTVCLGGINLRLMRSGHNEFMSQVIQSANDYYAYVFTCSLQTLPRSGNPYFMIKPSIRRFDVSSRWYLKNNMSAYVRVDSNHYQKLMISKGYPKDGSWVYSWDKMDEDCYNLNSMPILPSINELKDNSQKYLDEKASIQILRVISSENNIKHSKVGTGVSFQEKRAIYFQLLQILDQYVK